MTISPYSWLSLARVKCHLQLLGTSGSKDSDWSSWMWETEGSSSRLPRFPSSVVLFTRWMQEIKRFGKLSLCCSRFLSCHPRLICSHFFPPPRFDCWYNPGIKHSWLFSFRHVYDRRCSCLSSLSVINELYSPAVPVGSGTCPCSTPPYVSHWEI